MGINEMIEEKTISSGDLLRVNRFKLISSLDEVSENYKLYYFVDKLPDEMKEKLHNTIKNILETSQGAPAGVKRGYLEYIPKIGIHSLSVCDFVYDRGVNPIRDINGDLYIWGQITTLKDEFDYFYSILEIMTRINILSFILDNFDCLFDDFWPIDLKKRFYEISTFTNFIEVVSSPRKSLVYRMIGSINYKTIYCDKKENLQNEFEKLKKMFVEDK